MQSTNALRHGKQAPGLGNHYVKRRYHAVQLVIDRGGEAKDRARHEVED
jgi:hypothetical protein